VEEWSGVKTQVTGRNGKDSRWTMTAVTRHSTRPIDGITSPLTAAGQDQLASEQMSDTRIKTNSCNTESSNTDRQTPPI